MDSVGIRSRNRSIYVYGRRSRNTANLEVNNEILDTWNVENIKMSISSLMYIWLGNVKNDRDTVPEIEEKEMHSA